MLMLVPAWYSRWGGGERGERALIRQRKTAPRALRAVTLCQLSYTRGHPKWWICDTRQNLILWKRSSSFFPQTPTLIQHGYQVLTSPHCYLIGLRCTIWSFLWWATVMNACYILWMESELLKPTGLLSSSPFHFDPFGAEKVWKT